MSAANLRFQVDSRLATLLSQEYRSTERALKELVDNAWDADADQVSIQLPKPLSGEPIVIRDDGTGMTEEELRRHYLTIAKDRRSARGERTTGKNRQVKPEFDSSKAHFRPTPSNGAGFRAMGRQKPRYTGC